MAHSFKEMTNIEAESFLVNFEGFSPVLQSELKVLIRSFYKVSLLKLIVNHDEINGQDLESIIISQPQLLRYMTVDQIKNTIERKKRTVLLAIAEKMGIIHLG